jgi:hypothetical protein
MQMTNIKALETPGRNRALLEKAQCTGVDRHMVSIVLSPSFADRALFTLDEYTSDDKKGRRQ